MLIEDPLFKCQVSTSTKVDFRRNIGFPLNFIGMYDSICEVAHK